MPFSIKRNILHYYRSLIKDKQFESCEYSLHNIIRAMKISRHSICKEDFSNLDFGNIPLNDIYFSDKGKYPSSFNSSKFNECNIINGHFYSITYASFSPDCNLIATGSDGGEVIVWNLKNTMIQYKFKFDYSINVVEFLSDFEILIGTDKFIFVCNLKSDGIIEKFPFNKQSKTYYDKLIELSVKKAMPVYFCSKRKYIKINSLSENDYSYDSFSPCVWDSTNHKIIKKLNGHEAPVNMIAISKNEKYICTCSIDRSAIIWDTKNFYPIIKLKGNLSNVLSIALSNKGNALLVGSFHTNANLFDVNKNKILTTFREHMSGVECVAFSSSDRFFATGSWDHRIRIWNFASKKLMYELICPSAVTLMDISDKYCIFVNHNSPKSIIAYNHQTKKHLFSANIDFDITAISISVKGDFCAVGTVNGIVFIFNFKTCKRIPNVIQFKSKITAISILEEDFLYCAIGFDDGSVALWNVQLNKTILIKEFQSEILHIKFFNSKNIVGISKTEARIFDIDLKTCKYTYNGSTLIKPAEKACISSCGLYAAVNSGDNIINVINIKTGTTLAQFTNINIYFKNCTFLNADMDNICENLFFQQGGISEG